MLMKNTFIKLFAILTLLLFFSVSKSISEVYSKLTDIDSNVYNIVIISKQEWMAENLKVGKFRNGDVISKLRTSAEWLDAAKKDKPGWCYYNFDPENGKKFGKLYKRSENVF